MELDFNKIYQNKYEFTHLPAKDLAVGTKIVCMVSINSSSYGSWCVHTNKNYGFVLINGYIAGIRSCGKRIVSLSLDEIHRWELPIGDEKRKQAVGMQGDPVDHIVKVVN